MEWRYSFTVHGVYCGGPVQDVRTPGDGAGRSAGFAAGFCWVETLLDVVVFRKSRRDDLRSHARVVFLRFVAAICAVRLLWWRAPPPRRLRVRIPRPGRRQMSGCLTPTGSSGISGPTALALRFLGKSSWTECDAAARSREGGPADQTIALDAVECPVSTGEIRRVEYAPRAERWGRPTCSG